MARMSSATSTKKADPTGPLRRSRPNRTPGCRRRAGMLSRRLYDGVGESLDHRGARTGARERLRPRGPTRPLTLWTTPQLSPRPAVVASVTVVSGFRDAFPAPGNVAAKRCASEKRAFWERAGFLTPRND